MKTKKRFHLVSAIISLTLILVISNCTDENEPEVEVVLPSLTTNEVTEITDTTATSGGVILSDGGSTIIACGICWGTDHNPTIDNNKTSDVIVDSSFTSIITDLSDNTTYYIRAYATNSKGTGYGIEVSFTTLETVVDLFNPDITYGTMTDIDGNIYKTVTIGAQTWMAENLKTTRFNDGTEIPLVTDNTEWKNLSTPGFCWYYNDSITYAQKYGALYNWYTVETGNLCPVGWHIPTDDEWKTLEMALGMSQEMADMEDSRGTDEGDKLKSTQDWSDNGNGNNSSGFTGLPAGSRLSVGLYNYVNEYGSWWSSTENNIEAWYRMLANRYSMIIRMDADKKTGLSVRCIKD